MVQRGLQLQLVLLQIIEHHLIQTHDARLLTLLFQNKHPVSVIYKPEKKRPLHIGNGKECRCVRHRLFTGRFRNKGLRSLRGLLFRRSALPLLFLNIASDPYLVHRRQQHIFGNFKHFAALPDKNAQGDGIGNQREVFGNRTDERSLFQRIVMVGLLQETVNPELQEIPFPVGNVFFNLLQGV